MSGERPGLMAAIEDMGKQAQGFHDNPDWRSSPTAIQLLLNKCENVTRAAAAIRTSQNPGRKPPEPKVAMNAGTARLAVSRAGFASILFKVETIFGPIVKRQVVGQLPDLSRRAVAVDDVIMTPNIDHPVAVEFVGDMMILRVRPLPSKEPT